MGIKKRAISETQKLQRKREILKTTLDLYKKYSFDEISMDNIAKHAGMAKGTIFLYFKTKEELFLTLTKEVFIKLFYEMNISLEGKIFKSIDDFLKIISDSLNKDQIILRLISILNITLEKNVDYVTVRDFKIMLYNNLGKTGALLEKSLNFLNPGEGSKILMWLYILIIGVQHVANPTPIGKEVIKKANLQAFNINFKDQLLEMLKLLLYGLKK